MTGRRSARVAAKAGPNASGAEPASSEPAASKRKAETQSGRNSKRGRKPAEKAQTKIENTLATENTAEAADLKTSSEGQAETTSGSQAKSQDDHQAPGTEAQTSGDQRDPESEKKVNGFAEIMKSDKNEGAETTPDGTGSKVSAEDDAIKVEANREEALPSNVLEKGIIYFFFRGRVGIENPGKTDEVARSYIVLRPIPDGSALKEGPIGDSESLRLLALPKKVLPVSPKDRFMTFVEKAKTTIDSIKEQLSASDYSTKTAGVRHTPSADPIGEGVYAITQTGRETHLAYILTLPVELNDVQKDIGLGSQGSFLTSAKNPQSAAPANASLPQGAEYPQEIQDEFGTRGWMPLKPELLDYDNTQFLLIGHRDDALEKATKAQDEDEQNDKKVTPLEEMEKLENEDEHRVQSLGVNAAVFTDLGLSSKEFSKVRTSW